jgi:uncharacterized protein
MTATAPSPASPCNNVCRIDEASGLCLGCQRTLAEIAAWGASSDDERRAVLARLPARRNQRRAVDQPACEEPKRP